jgi:hypothetical protein
MVGCFVSDHFVGCHIFVLVWRDMNDDASHLLVGQEDFVEIAKSFPNPSTCAAGG